MVKRMYLKDTEAALQFAAADYFHQTGDNELLDYNNQYDVTTVLYRMKTEKNIIALTTLIWQHKVI